MSTTASSSLRDTPKVLLAWAKDERYMQYIQSLLRDILGYEDETNDATTWYIGSMLTILFFVGRNGKTRGMEACGQLTYQPSNQQLRVVLSMMVAATLRFLIQRTATTPTTSTSTSTTRDNTSNITSTNHQLRGDARRQFHEQQRQAMLRRAAAVGDPSLTSAIPLSSPATLANNNVSSRLAVTKRIQFLFLEIVKSLGHALAMPLEGPHALVQSSSTATLSRGGSVGGWLVRLFLAYYCYHGRLPSWMHQPIHEASPLNGKQHSKSTTATSRTPSTVKLVAWLIGMQAGATVLQLISRLLIRYYMLPKRRLGGSSESWDCDDTATRVNQIMGLSPPCLSSQLPQPPLLQTGAMSLTSGDKRGGGSKESSWWCGICRMPCNTALPLAAPVTCGHVFCWDCLMQWVCHSTATSPTRRSECPLCRSPCTPQQVLDLYF